MQNFGKMLVVLGLIGCSLDEHAPPVRPTGVPPDALWVGGADGGAWLRCTRISGAPDYRCDAFFESGDLESSGRFRCEPRRPGGCDFDPSDVRNYEVWDGHAIITTTAVLHRPDPVD